MTAPQTVAQLIEQLSAFPPDMPVIITAEGRYTWQTGPFDMTVYEAPVPVFQLDREHPGLDKALLVEI